MTKPSLGPRTIVSPEGQSATFIELFFDLVFVFSVTQIVGLLHGGLSLLSISQAVLVFWLVWWAWTQFTWALNAADTTHTWVELATLLATALAFLMATALPGAFLERALWFSLAYVLVRIVGLTLYIWVSWVDPEQRAAVTRFTLVSCAGLGAAVLGGVLGGGWQYALWGLTILLDIIAAGVGGSQEGWNLHAEHFAERHGLFTIIALGETLIVAAGGVTEEAWTPSLIGVAVLSVLLTCGLWWCYFPTGKPVLEQAMASLKGPAQSSLARDAFSLLHFPMMCGVVAYAFAVEEAVAHPNEPLALAIRLALGAGVALFVGGMALALWRATGRLAAARAVLSLLILAAVVAAAGVPPFISLAIALLGVLLVPVAERRMS